LPSTDSANNTASGREIDRALRMIVEQTHDGLRHGFFEITIAGEMIKGGKRRLVVRSGKSHQFIVDEAELK